VDLIQPRGFHIVELGFSCGVGGPLYRLLAAFVVADAVSIRPHAAFADVEEVVEVFFLEPELGLLSGLFVHDEMVSEAAEVYGAVVVRARQGRFVPFSGDCFPVDVVLDVELLLVHFGSGATDLEEAALLDVEASDRT
jgi:hypothetical protein